ncbi:MAG TPA: hypothetical protein VEH27_12810 [Methylomirabilota bacterium]|nr:hypothetical protein [Methylomirabilota bacterium]
MAASGAESAPAKPFPYHGKLASVDPQKMTITLEGKKQPRVILVTGATKFTRDGKTVKLADGRPGDPVAGLMIKTAEGKQQAISVRFGPKEEAASAAPKKSPPR